MPPVRVLRSFAHPPWPWLFALAGIGLVLSAIGAGYAAVPAFCGAGTASLLIVSGWPEALGLVLALNPPARLALDWVMMLLAMMPPLLAMPLMHVWRASLPRRRWRAMASFTVGYGLVWVAVGPVLMGLAIVLRLAVGEGALAAALLLATVWSAGPWQRAALNRGHRLSRIGLFGWAADRDCLAFGLIHAVWCVTSCWTWMLVPLVAERFHVAVMMTAGAVMLVERLAPPRPARWRLPVLLRAFARRPALVTPQEACRHG